MILESINPALLNILNSEGPIVSLYNDQHTGSLFIRSKICNSGIDIFAKTSKSILRPYFQGRIPLQSVFELKSDSHFFLRIDRTHVIAKFLEITSEKAPIEIEQICCGKDLFPLFPSGMKPNLSVHQILELIPESKEFPQKIEIGEYNISPGGFTIFSEDSKFLQVVNFENDKINNDDYDAILYLSNMGDKLLIKITPASLKLYITGQLGILDLAMINDSYILNEDLSTASQFSFQAHTSIVKSLVYGNTSYFQLPKEIQIDSPLELWKYYQDYLTINGRGVVHTSEFKKEYPIKLKIKK